MFELVVLAQKLVAERTLEQPATVIPDRPFALDANRVLEVEAYRGCQAGGPDIESDGDMRYRFTCNGQAHACACRHFLP